MPSQRSLSDRTRIPIDWDILDIESAMSDTEQGFFWSKSQVFNQPTLVSESSCDLQDLYAFLIHEYSSSSSGLYIVDGTTYFQVMYMRQERIIASTSFPFRSHDKALKYCLSITKGLITHMSLIREGQ